METAVEQQQMDRPLEFVEAFEEELKAIYPQFNSPHPRTEAMLYRAVHSAKEPLTALCLSGGGVRSATFSLGVVQGLARCGLLPRFHYLSTVSGGGYLGSWLTAWIRHTSDDIERHAAEITAPSRAQPTGADRRLAPTKRPPVRSAASRASACSRLRTRHGVAGKVGAIADLEQIAKSR